ncbi:MAG: hypothetical protein ACFFE2_16010 [Candidatus Thorarchaeota archaeon]
MGRSPAAIIVLILTICILGIVTINTLNESGAPVDLELTLKAEYDGTTVGSTTLKYRWLSKAISQDHTTEEIDWHDNTVTVNAITSNSIESTIKEYLNSATQSSSWLTIEEDGHWSVSFTIMIGGSLPIYLTFFGIDGIVTDVVVSSDVNLLPTGLKTALNNLGVTNIDLILGWKLVISGDFIEDWLRNLFELVREGIQTIVDESNEFLGSLDII